MRDSLKVNDYLTGKYSPTELTKESAISVYEQQIKQKNRNTN